MTDILTNPTVHNFLTSLATGDINLMTGLVWLGFFNAEVRGGWRKDTRSFWWDTKLHVIRIILYFSYLSVLCASVVR